MRTRDNYWEGSYPSLFSHEDTFSTQKVASKTTHLGSSHLFDIIVGLFKSKS